jgi:hypothetical protein
MKLLHEVMILKSTLLLDTSRVNKISLDTDQCTTLIPIGFVIALPLNSIFYNFGAKIQCFLPLDSPFLITR